jgi:cytochrome-b5 reductase
MLLKPLIKRILPGKIRVVTTSLLWCIPFAASSDPQSAASIDRQQYCNSNHLSFTQREASSIMEKGQLPSTMTGPPVAALVEPGVCQFNAEWIKAPLLERWIVSPTTKLLRFGLPDIRKSLGLSTCACILAHAKIDEEDVVRPYTPISTNANIGYFDLLVKHYGPTSKMSRHMHDTMLIGDELEFKHIEFNVKIQAPFGKPKHIGMIVGGTGITPMIQALHAILGSSDSPKPKVTMLYGSKFANDILGYEILQQWSTNYKDQLEVIHVLSDEEPTSAWTGKRGFINQSLIEQYFPPPAENPLIFVCGPPPMYNALSGPREENQVTGVLGQMGYQTEHVYKF